MPIETDGNRLDRDRERFALLNDATGPKRGQAIASYRESPNCASRKAKTSTNLKILAGC
ncbi:hypothetical protein H6G52_03715 [Limnothrix sp. FACHB-881]|uniref:Transposase n=1 Tax=Limnothrix redekei LRLZ20PSL1 TaxID=3112953 RepID=A0ABW7CAG0_9CYAN|nr:MULTISPECIES: hypothetical protein [unclassified Limnothrix]MBD2159567.1 hypothetical protein [Limnothrix sp. FACHB-1083]MBD2190269.1 hypothetical protein [Limnothrix sp. FACHB-1088]MBD2634458.1 hypothetical protein [Limnothrix sp. FACHB-881]